MEDERTGCYATASRLPRNTRYKKCKSKTRVVDSYKWRLIAWTSMQGSEYSKLIDTGSPLTKASKSALWQSSTESTQQSQDLDRRDSGILAWCPNVWEVSHQLFQVTPADRGHIVTLQATLLEPIDRSMRRQT